MLEENQTEVNEPEESSTSESIEDSGELQESHQSPDADVHVPSETEEAPTSPEPQLGQKEVDDLGVPWKNRYMESQKKLDKLSEQLNVLTEKIDAPREQKQEKYSIEELEAFAEETDNSAHKQWAKSEIRRLQKEEIRNEMKSVFSEHQAVQQKEKVRQEALHTVMSKYPDAFKKDGNGNPVGWNENSPLAQRIGAYMQDQEISNNPRGLLVAAALAFSDVAPTIAAQANAKAVQAKSEVKSLQKKTLTEGGGVSSPPQPKTPANSARERLSQTGNIKDGAVAFKEILKSRGRIKEG